ncbi:hypothetical protein KPH14_012277 [Odynerus spinipes]|uniref:Uncharacterized protein n=1 Tax=Odynerus spinipes TaxID=1348599 RepID=A0AAD9RGR3_9HYME|nr:hypothetical protein KPH14_012277 [Odynerus spinipes]
MAITESAIESVYLRNFLKELGFLEFMDIAVFNDNLGAKRLADNASFSTRSKHIDLRHHFVREVLNNRQMKIEYIPTEDMPAGMMTKGLPGPKHKKCCKEIGLNTVFA